MVTLVSSLYDIDREKFDGRKFEQYLEWFEKTLKLNCLFIVFGPESLKDFVKNVDRGNSEIVFIESKIEDCLYYKFKRDMDLILSSSDFIEKMSDTNRIECKSSLYSIVQYSKFEWMEKASSINPFNSEYFIWVDAGLSRFFDNLDLSKTYPSQENRLILLNNKDKILLQVFSSSYPDLFNAENLDDGYFYDNRSYVMGGMFGGGKEIIKEVNEIIIAKFEENLKKNVVNNEQIMLGYLYKKYPDKFVPFVHLAGYRSYELINALGN
jgi:hypothetical protein